jgi:hypothetical protein
MSLYMQSRPPCTGHQIHQSLPSRPNEGWHRHSGTSDESSKGNSSLDGMNGGKACDATKHDASCGARSAGASCPIQECFTERPCQHINRRSDLDQSHLIEKLRSFCDDIDQVAELLARPLQGTFTIAFRHEYALMPGTTKVESKANW